MQAWAQLTGVELSLWDVSVLRRMDAATLAVYAEKIPRSGQSGSRRTREIMVDDVAAIERMFDRFG